MAIYIGLDIAGPDDTDTSINVTVPSYEKFLTDEAKVSESVAGKIPSQKKKKKEYK